MRARGTLLIFCLLGAGGLLANELQAAVFITDSIHLTTIENAFILWNPDTKVQHLLLSFRVDVDGDFAFLLPFPSPVLASVEIEDLSMTLSSLIASYRSRAHRWEVPSRPAGGPRDALVVGGTEPIDVIIHEHPAETIPRFMPQADRAHALALRDYWNRYEDGYSLVEVRGRGKRSLTSPYLHVQCRVPRPWYPYREPAIPRGYARTSRLLRVTVLSTEQVALQQGESLPTMNHAWLAFEPSHHEVNKAFDSFSSWLAVRPETRLWLTSFEDRHPIRPGNDDWTFARSGDIPPSGHPGTIDDHSQAGIVFDDPSQEASVDESPTVELSDIERAREPVATVSKQRRGRAMRAPVVFGTMVTLALGIAIWLNRWKQS